MNQFNRIFLLGVLLSLLLSACGIKGPLYIPEDPSKKYPHQRNERRNEPLSECGYKDYNLANVPKQATINS